MYNIVVENIKIEYSDITFNRDSHCNRIPIGTGTFGEVYVATLRAQEIAVKELKHEAIKSVNELLSEANILKRMKHPNIVNLYGVCTDIAKNSKNIFERENFYCLVMEYASKGSLHNIIHESNEVLDETRIISILKQIALGLDYLHSSSPPIIHGDLKPTNILFDIENNVKLTDFGFSTIKREIREYNSETTSKGQLRWMAPELLTENPSPKSDIFSFGVIIWQLCTRKHPYPDAKNEVQVYNSIRNSNIKNFEFPPSTPELLKELGKQCLDYDKTNRPNLDVVLYKLEHTNRESPVKSIKTPKKEDRNNKDDKSNFLINQPNIADPLNVHTVTKKKNSKY